MNVASMFGPLIALAAAWGLLSVKRKLPARPDRRYRCILARAVEEESPEAPAGPTSPAEPLPEEPWVSPLEVSHEQYVQ